MQKSEKEAASSHLSPQGEPFSQTMAEELAKEEELVRLRALKEGIDERVLGKV